MQHNERTLVLELITQRVVLVVLEGGLPHGEALVGDDEADLVLAVHGDLRADKVEVELELLVLLVAQQLLPALVVKGVEAVEVQLLLLLEPDCGAEGERERRRGIAQRNCAAGRRGAHSASRSPSRGRPP